MGQGDIATERSVQRRPNEPVTSDDVVMLNDAEWVKGYMYNSGD